MHLRSLLSGISASSLLLASCMPQGSMTSVESEPAQVHVALTNIPIGAICLRFTSTPTSGGERVYQQLVSVTPGAPANVPIRGLPFGVSLSIMAETFSQACAEVDDRSLATWLSDSPAAVTLTYGQIAENVTFRMRPTGGANTSIDFLFFTLAPLSHSFGSVLMGAASAPQTFNLVNAATSATGTVSASITGTHAASFQIISNTCMAALPAGAACAVQIRCAPLTRGALNAMLQLTGAPGGAIASALTAVGLQPATLTLTPATLDFGTIGLGQASTPANFTLTNTGDVGSGSIGLAYASTTPGEIQSQFQTVSNTCPPIISAGLSCTISARFAPFLGIALGAKSATLTVSASPGGAGVANLSGNAVAAPAITVTPTPYTFAAPVGSVPPSNSFLVRNTGGIAVGPMTALIGGTNGSEFAIASSTCGVSVPVGGTCAIVIQALPAAPGIRSGNIVVTALPGVTATATFTINAPTLLVPSVTSINFGSVSGSGSAVTRNFTILNRGVVALPAIAFNSNTYYRVSTNGCNSLRAPGSSCSVTVSFDPPSTVGSTVYSFNLIGTSNSLNTVSVSLTGTGTL